MFCYLRARLRGSFTPPTLRAAIHLAAVYVVASLPCPPQTALASEARITVDYPIVVDPPRGAFTVPEKFRDYLALCRNDGKLSSIIEMATTKILQSSGYAISGDKVTSGPDTVELHYTMDPLTSDYVAGYNKIADRNMQLDTGRLYSEDVSLKFTTSEDLVKADTAVGFFYYVGKRRKPYDGPFDARAISKKLVADIFAGVREMTCQASP